MCAIVGLYSPGGQDGDMLTGTVERMQAAHRFRGPDGEGVWSDGRHTAIGSVRLAIQGDLRLGLQPLEDRWGGRLVFNGEVFEPRETLRSLGEAYHEADSDGVALEAILALRGPRGLDRLRGMFAVARYDPADGSLTLARDTWGQKPLFLARWRDGWAFSSTVAGLLAATGKRKLRDAAPLEYLVYKSVGGLHTSFDGVEQLPPGGWLRLLVDGTRESGRWTEPPPLADASPHPEEVAAELDRAVAVRASDRFANAVLLSGGADSAIIAASLVRQRPDLAAVAWSVGYDVRSAQDETGYAARMAEHLGLRHEVIRIAAVDVPGLLEEAARFTEDPIQDPVTLPTLALARMVARETKVALSGDGSDEFWGGYERFDDPPASLAEYLPRSTVFRPDELGLDAPPPSYLDDVPVPPPDMAPLDRILRLEASNRMRNYHLARVDKLGMAAALEIRSPFLDARLTRLAQSLPATAKRPGGRAKGLLLDAFARDLPDWLLHRKKQPFSVPVTNWLRGDLREYARDVLTDPQAWVRRFVDPAPYFKMLGREGGQPAAAARLWSLLQLEAWRRVWREHLA